MKNFYQTLNISKNASQSEVKQAFRILAHKYHPDKNSDINASDKFKEIYEAYEILVNHEKRKVYDILYEAQERQTKVKITSVQYQKYNSNYENWTKHAKSNAEKTAKMPFDTFWKFVESTTKFTYLVIIKPILVGCAYFIVGLLILGIIGIIFGI